MKKKWLNYSVDAILAVSFILVALSGLLKYQRVVRFFSWRKIFLPTDTITLIHDWSGLVLGIAVLFHLLLHSRWILSMTKNLLSLLKNAMKSGMRKRYWAAAAVIIAVSGILIAFAPSGDQGRVIVDLSPGVEKQLKGRIDIRGIGTYYFDPAEIESVRKDVFKPGKFSIFDILVYLHDKEQISMRYHFDDILLTHVIESINGDPSWWYTAYYDGGWREPSSFRMDLYPYKERMYIDIHPVKDELLTRIYSVFRDENLRLSESAGKVIIPEVRIAGTSEFHTFKNVEVTPHNLRSDMFTYGVVTAIDVILSLGDQNKLTYDLTWHDSIGTAQIVRSYFVSQINDDISRGRCGFVYESGSWDFGGFSGNHIHIPPDTRVITSPEYVMFFWICI